MMNREKVEGKRSWPNVRYYSGTFLGGLRRTTKNFNRDSRFPGRDLSLGPPVLEAGVYIILSESILLLI
jgi:hypothetical protein